MQQLWRKAQTATEYLIILAVVIIVALIVIGVMGGIPGIGGGAATRASAASWASAPVAITSYSISAADDQVTLNIRNNQRNSITVTTVTLLNNTGSQAVNSSSIVLAVGETKTFKGPDGGLADGCGSSGDSFAYGVQIQYTDSATGAVYTETAGGTDLTGSCAS